MRGLPVGALLAPFCVVVSSIQWPERVESGIQWPERVVSSYCTGGCTSDMLRHTLSAINAFSVTSFYISDQGSVMPCNDQYSACNWTDGNVSEANTVLQATGARAQPLLFSNSGNMVRAFRALVAAPGGMAAAAEALEQHVMAYNFARVQLDLEPSCWAANASQCQWPNRTDALNFVAFINATADALAKTGADVSVAVGAWPESQCTSAQYVACQLPGVYPAGCTSGATEVATCNCCAYTAGWFDVPALCASRAAAIVNMDTYQNAPANLTAFRAALDWYSAQGCAPARLAVGLLADEAATVQEADAVIDAVMAAGVVEMDIWADLWQQSSRLEAWRPALQRFLDGAPPPATRLAVPWACIAIGLGVVGVVCTTTVLIRRQERRRRRKSGAAEAANRLPARERLLGEPMPLPNPGSGLHRRMSSMAVLERDAPVLGPSLLAIGSGTGSAIAFGSPYLCNGASGLAALTSEPALASVLSMASKGSATASWPPPLARESSWDRESSLSRTSDADGRALAAGEASERAPLEDVAAGVENGADAADTTDTADAADAAWRSYAWNATTLPLLHLLVGMVNNIQGVAWREYLLHSAAHG